MRRSIISTSYAALAFAAADKGTGPDSTAPIAGDSAADPATPATPAPANAAIEAIKVEANVEALKEALGGQRVVFSTFTAAYEKLTAISEGEKTKDLFGLPVAIVGLSEDGETVDESVYDGANAILAYVGARGVLKSDAKNDKDVFNSIKAVVIYPVPTLETFLGVDSATVAAMPETQRNWLDKVITKETSHVAFRNFRDATTINELMNGAKAAPKSVDDYVTASNREGDGLNTDTFDALWQAFRTMLRTQQPAVFKLLPGKPEVVKALRSKAYAESTDETKPLEEHGIFEKIGQMLIAGAKANKDKDGNAAPLESETLESWLAGRDTLVLTKQTAQEKDFSVLGSLNW